jgi:hypothetical protein
MHPSGVLHAARPATASRTARVAHGCPRNSDVSMSECDTCLSEYLNLNLNSWLSSQNRCQIALSYHLVALSVPTATREMQATTKMMTSAVK